MGRRETNPQVANKLQLVSKINLTFDSV